MCDCRVCVGNRRIDSLMEGMADNAKALINELRDTLVDVENDRDYYKAIVQGVWLNADEVIKSSREMFAKRMAAVSATSTSDIQL